MYRKFKVKVNTVTMDACVLELKLCVFEEQNHVVHFCILFQGKFFADYVKIKVGQFTLSVGFAKVSFTSYLPNEICY